MPNTRLTSCGRDIISGRLGFVARQYKAPPGLLASEVCAESWPGQGLLSLAD